MSMETSRPTSSTAATATAKKSANCPAGVPNRESGNFPGLFFAEKSIYPQQTSGTMGSISSEKSTMAAPKAR